jgi:hypothetical protein
MVWKPKPGSFLDFALFGLILSLLLLFVVSVQIRAVGWRDYGLCVAVTAFLLLIIAQLRRRRLGQVATAPVSRPPLTLRRRLAIFSGFFGAFVLVQAVTAADVYLFHSADTPHWSWIRALLLGAALGTSQALFPDWRRASPRVRRVVWAGLLGCIFVMAPAIVEVIARDSWTSGVLLLWPQQWFHTPVLLGLILALLAPTFVAWVLLEAIAAIRQGMHKNAPPSPNSRAT